MHEPKHKNTRSNIKRDGRGHEWSEHADQDQNLLYRCHGKTKRTGKLHHQLTGNHTVYAPTPNSTQAAKLVRVPACRKELKK